MKINFKGIFTPRNILPFSVLLLALSSITYIFYTASNPCKPDPNNTKKCTCESSDGDQEYCYKKNGVSKWPAHKGRNFCEDKCTKI